MDENKQSRFMQWAKLSSVALYNLAISGVLPYPLKELGVRIEDLEMNGPTIYGYEPLQKALADKAGVEPDCIATATGTSMANHIVMAALLNAGDEVLIEQPTYEPILAVARYLGTSIRRFSREFDEGFQVRPKTIQEKITSKTKVIILTNLHNPTGVLTTRETLEQIGEIANEVGARILVDEVYLECTYPDPGMPVSAFHLGKHFIATSSLTKAYGLSGLRCGWILAEPDLIRKFWRLNDLFGATPPHTPELLSVIALNRLNQIGERAKQLLETNRALFEKIVDRVNYFLEIVHPEYGTILFPRLKAGGSDRFVDLLREKYQTSVVPGSFFEMPDHFRLGLGGPTDNVRQGLENLVQALELRS